MIKKQTKIIHKRKRKVTHNDLEGPQKKRVRRKKLKLTDLPTEILAEVLQYLPREDLLKLNGQCKSVRNAVGYIVRIDFNRFRKKLDDSINGLVKSCYDINDGSFRQEICRKIGYLRMMRLYFGTIEALIGNDKYNKETWNLFSVMLINVLKEQNNLLLSVINYYPYFYKDIRAKYIRYEMPKIVNFFNLYFDELEPQIIKMVNNQQPYCIKIFNLLNSCPSSNMQINVYHPVDSNISFVDMFFELRGLGRKFEFELFKEFYKSDLTPEKKLNNLIKYFFYLIENENSEFLQNHLEHLLNLEFIIEHTSMNEDVTDELIKDLSKTYNLFLNDPYKIIKSNKTKFYCDGVKIFKKEITRDQEIRTCVSSVTCRLKFCCDRKILPESIQLHSFQDYYRYYKNYGSQINENYVKENFLENLNGVKYLNLKKLFGINKPEQMLNATKNKSKLLMDLFITHSERARSLLVTVQQLKLLINGNKVVFKVLKDDVLNRFNEYSCECNTKGFRCEGLQKYSWLPATLSLST